MLSFHFVDYSAEGSGRLRSASNGLKHFFLFSKKIYVHLISFAIILNLLKIRQLWEKLFVIKIQEA